MGVIILSAGNIRPFNTEEILNLTNLHYHVVANFKDYIVPQPVWADMTLSIEGLT